MKALAPKSLLIGTALCGFAANSLLCRAALGGDQVDAFSFTAVRLLSGALMLGLLARKKNQERSARGSWKGAAALFLYALAFALAYRTMSAATGALLLFATVQLAMIGFGLWQGERLTRRQKIGCALACIGLVLLTLPGLAAPQPHAALLMAGAGAAWASYSLLGRKSQQPLIDSAGNFVKASGLALVVLALAWLAGALALPMRPEALLWSVVSGAFASGLAYAIWYRVLPELDAWRAGLLQLLTPVLAALGGFFLLDESLDFRFMLAAGIILLGLFCSLKTVSPSRAAAVPETPTTPHRPAGTSRP